MQEQICVVVGGAKGRGRRLVREYAGRKYVIAFMDIDKAAGNVLKKEIEQEYGSQVFFFHGDAESEEDRGLFAGAVIGQYDRIDCLYYRSDIAQGMEVFGELLEGHLKKEGIVEDFFCSKC